MVDCITPNFMFYLTKKIIWNSHMIIDSLALVIFSKKKCPPPGFTGLLCEENINECIPEPCHHGVCKDGIATFSCECYPGYTGSICNIQVQECHSNPCQNRGRCIDLVNAYQCNCPAGTTGKYLMCKKALLVSWDKLILIYSSKKKCCFTWGTWWRQMYNSSDRMFGDSIIHWEKVNMLI